MIRVTAVATSVMVSCALGMIPPVVSFTVPVSVAPATWACAWPAPKTAMATITSTQARGVKFRINSLGSIEFPLIHGRTDTLKQPYRITDKGQIYLGSVLRLTRL